MNRKIGIVVIAYNRIESLNRLLDSLLNAEYFGDKVDLIISIDYHKDYNKQILNLAQSFRWHVGEKKIINHLQNLGLKEHIISCGKYSEYYDNICVLEDDIFLSPSFYSFTKQATAYYSDSTKIAGISLYSHKINYIEDRFFLPLENGHDTYFMQQAQSWGQVWNSKSWNEFIDWLHKDVKKHIDFPSTIYNWPDTSWLKLQMQFIVEKDKYFVYPYKSLSSNFSDNGTHAFSTNKYQVELSYISKKKYNFPNFDSNTLNYDVYFESNMLKNFIEEKFNMKQEVTVDLYQAKIRHKRYLLTTRRLNFKIIKKYGLNLRPHELNVMLKNNGEGIYLYDTEISEKNFFEKKVSLLLYDYRICSIKTALLILIRLLKDKIKLKL